MFCLISIGALSSVSGYYIVHYPHMYRIFLCNTVPSSEDSHVSYVRADSVLCWISCALRAKLKQNRYVCVATYTTVAMLAQDYRALSRDDEFPTLMKSVGLTAGLCG
jgi:hypothetical protein